MRLAGLTLCLLASSLGARAELIEDRMASLERRVKVLEEALRDQSEVPELNGSRSATLDKSPALPRIEGGDAGSDKTSLIQSK